MKVKELIGYLQKANQEAKVRIQLVNGGFAFNLDNILYGNDTVELLGEDYEFEEDNA